MQVPSLTTGESWEYETDKRSILLQITDLSKGYMVSVCAVNHLGQHCSSPQEVLVNTTNPKPVVQSDGLVRRQGKKMSLGLVIAIAVVVPVMILVLCIAVAFVVVVCKYYSRSKEYYPTRQGIIPLFTL